jgi:hypothetical protein
MFSRSLGQITTDESTMGNGLDAERTSRRVSRLARAVVLVLATPMIASATTPASMESSKFFPGDVTSSFGSSVAVYGDTAVVGDPLNGLDGSTSGAAWVFVRSGTTWVEQTRLIPSGASANDRFGTSVDIYDNYIVVGSPNDIGAGGTTGGSAYVFRRDGATWIEETKLIGSATVIGDPWDGPGSGDNFGHSVAINGDVPADATSSDIWHNIIVGAPEDTHSQTIDAGSVHAYQLSADGSAWIPMGKIYSNSPAGNDRFGQSVDLDGDHMIVGAYLDGDDLAGGITNPGAAYVWVRRGILGMWSLETRLTAGDPEAHDHFGQSVAVNAYGGLATFVVGAPGDDDLGTSSGSAYIFRGSAQTFPQLPKLQASDGSTSGGFGSSVAVDNDLMLIGATGAGALGEGSVYVIGRDGYSWVESQRLTASFGTVLDELGISVALTGDVALAGSPAADGSTSYGGAIYVFDDLIDVHLFSDDFESGNTGAWSAATP